MGARAEAGQASAEYVGLLAFLALLASALLTVGSPSMVGELGLAVCDATGFCDGVAGVAEPPTPAESYEAALALGLEEFLALAASSERDERLDWTEDGCSRVPDEIPSFDFHAACIRHDFAYRNAALSGSSPTARAAADARFREDMSASCERQGAVDGFECRLWADAYWRGVRGLGGAAYGD